MGVWRCHFFIVKVSNISADDRVVLYNLYYCCSLYWCYYYTFIKVYYCTFIKTYKAFYLNTTYYGILFPNMSFFRNILSILITCRRHIFLMIDTIKIFLLKIDLLYWICPFFITGSHMRSDTLLLVSCDTLSKKYLYIYKNILI